MTKYIRGVFPLLLLFAAVGPALAKDVCVISDSGIAIVFKKVAPLSPGSVIPLTGLYVSPGVAGDPFPCVGAAAMNSEGSQIQVGIFCHTMLVGNSFAWAWTAHDETLAGAGYDDENGDNLPEDPQIISSVPCETVTIP